MLAEPKSVWDKGTAEAYAAYTKHWAMYACLAHELIGLARTEPGMCAVDLACGTGVATHEILRAVGSSGRVCAVDASPAMLSIARHEIRASNVDFILADAVDLKKAVPETEIDLIVCSCAFRWFGDYARVLGAIWDMLAPGGQFAFNFLQEGGPHPPALYASMVRIAADEYGYTAPVVRFGGFPNPGPAIRKAISRTTPLARIFEKNFSYQQSPEEGYALHLIPWMSEQVLPGMPFAKCVEILDRAWTACDRQPNNIRFVNMVLEKSRRK